MGSTVELRSALTQPVSRPGVPGFDPVGLEGDEGIGILRETGRHRLGQRTMTWIAAQYGLRQLQVKGACLAGQVEIVLGRPALRRQFVGNAADHHLTRRTGGQQRDQE